MAEMRYLDLLKGQVLTDYIYTWNTTYSKILLRDNLEANARITAVSATLTDTENTYADNILDFLMPFRYAYRTQFDGIARGNIHLYISQSGAGAAGYTQYAQVVVSIFARTSAGVDRTLGTVTTNEVTTSGVTELEVDIPFFVSLAHQILYETEMLVVRFNVKCKWAQTGAPGSHNESVQYRAALNTQNIFIELPVVLES